MFKHWECGQGTTSKPRADACLGPLKGQCGQLFNAKGQQAVPSISEDSRGAGCGEWSAQGGV